MAEEKFPWLTFVVVVIVIAAAVGGGIYLLSVTVNKRYSPSPPATIVEGDNVSVNYIGVFGTGINQGDVFDTSLLSVATNNATFPKALSFSFRGVSGYVPLEAHVGPQSYTPFSSLITGFWQGLIGMHVGQTKILTIPPSLGYGGANQSLIHTYPLVTTIPMVYTYSPSEFGTLYGGIAAQAGATFTDPHYGWTDVILASNSTSVVLEFAPYLGQVVHPYSWPVVVTNVSTPHNGTGAITLTNQLYPSDVGSIKGNNTGTSGQTFYLTNVNPEAGTYTLDYNPETAGNTLIFTVTVVQLF